MARVALTFEGNNRGAVQAAKGTAEAIEAVKKTSAEAAVAAGESARKQQQVLRDTAEQYSKVAAAAKVGSEEQVTASRLAAEANAKLAASNVESAAKERKGLEELAAEYGRIAAAAKKGSDEQISAARLASEANAKVKSSTEESTKAVNEHSEAFKGLAKSVALYGAAYIGVTGVKDVFEESIGEAENLQKQLERTTALFGKNAAGIRAWAEEGAKNLGLWKGAALDSANTVGTLLKNVGIAPPKVAAMSKSVVQLAADMAAFKNVDPSVTLSALESGLQGRTRTLKQFGVVIDAASQSEYAYANGIAKTTVDTEKVQVANEKALIAQQHLTDAIAKYGPRSVEAAQAQVALEGATTAATKASGGHQAGLTDEQKALATYGLIMQQTSVQQGAFRKGSGDLAQQEAVLHAEVKNVKEELGNATIPLLEKYLPILSDWIDKNDKNGTFQRDFNTAVKDGTKVIDGVAGVVKTAVGAFDLLKGAVGGDKRAIELLIAAFATLKAAGKATEFSGVLGSIAGIGTNAKTSTGEVKTLGSALKGIAGRVFVATLILDMIPRSQKGQQQLDQLGLGALGSVPGLGPLFTQEGAAASVFAHTSDPISSGVSGGNSSPYPKGTEEDSLYQDGLQGKPLPNPSAPKIGAGYAAYMAGVKASQKVSTPEPDHSYDVNPKSNTAATGIVAEAKKAGVGSGAIYGTTQLGSVAGTAGGGRVFDCSGYTYKVYTSAGYQGFPGTSETQWSEMDGPNWTSIQVGTSDAQPGDLVFMVGADGPSPGHVGIVTSGSGMNATVMQYYSTGHEADTIPLSSIGDIVGLKRFYLAVKQDGPTSGSSNSGTGAGTQKKKTGMGSNTGFVKKAKPVKLTPLQRTVASLGTSVDDTVAKANNALKNGLITQPIADEIDKRAKAIHASLKTATTADIPAIKANMAGLGHAITDGLKQATEESTVTGAIGRVNKALAAGLIPKTTADSIIAKGAKLAGSLARTIGDPTKLTVAKDAYNKAVTHTIAEGAKQLADEKTVGASISKVSKAISDGLLPQSAADSILGRGQRLLDSLATKIGDPTAVRASVAAYNKAVATALADGAKQIGNEQGAGTAIQKVATAIDNGLISKKQASGILARGQALMDGIARTLGNPAKARAAVAAYNKTVDGLLKATAAKTALDTTLKTDTVSVNDNLKDGLLTPGLAAALDAKAKALNKKIAADVYDSKAFTADSAAAKGLQAQITEALAQVADVVQENSDLKNMATTYTATIQQALSEPVSHATVQAVKNAQQGAAQVREKLLTATNLTAADRTKLESQLAIYEQTIQDGLDGILQTLSDSKDKFESVFSSLSTDTLAAFDKATQDKLAAMQKNAQDAINALQVTVQGSGFADFVYGGSVTQTPTEKLLADMADAKQTAGDASAITDAQTALDAANTALAAGTSGTPGGTATRQLGNGVTLTGTDPAATGDDLAALQKAVVDAQKSLDDAVYQQKTDALQKTADLERTAADQQLQDAQTAAQNLETQQEQAYTDQRTAQETQLQALLTSAQTQLEQGKTTLSTVAGEIGDALGGGLTDGIAPYFDPSNPTGIAATLNTFLGTLATAQSEASSLNGLAGVAATDAGVTDPAAGAAAGPGSSGAASFQWGGKNWGPNDKAAFAAWLAVHGSTLAVWKANHPVEAAAVGYYQGGTVPGAYVGRNDTIMARLTPGEEVVDRATATQLRTFLADGGGGDTHYHQLFDFKGATIVGSNQRELEDFFAKHAAPGLSRIISVPMRR